MKTDKTKQNKIFLFVLSLSLFFPYAFLITGIRQIDISENRYTTKVAPLNKENFLSHTFQDNLENFVSDQYTFRAKIKQLYFVNREKYAKPLANALFQSIKCEDEYVKINKSWNYYLYNCEDYYVSKKNITKDIYQQLDAKVENYNKLSSSNINIYYYLVNNSANINFNDKDNNEVYNYLKDALKVDTISQLIINNYNQYKTYFNKTDHHWNHVGSYQAYLDMANMMFPEEELIKPKKEVCYSKFNHTYGSLAKSMQNFKIDEPFCVNRYQLPQEIIYINDKKSTYNFEESYDNGLLENVFGQNHYGIYYGSDYPKLIIKGDVNIGKKLLIISNSFGNSVRHLLAQHYSETHEIDLRHYLNYYGKQFFIEEYIKENQITDVLYLGDLSFYTLATFNNNYKE